MQYHIVTIYGNPLQRSFLENPRDGGAWWAAVYGVAQSWTRLKQLSGGSSSMHHIRSYLTKEIRAKISKRDLITFRSFSQPRKP